MVNCCNKKMLLLLAHLYTIVCQLIIGYDIDLFLSSPQDVKDGNKHRPYAFCLLPSASFHDDLSCWNVAVVRWLGYIFKGRIPATMIPLASLITSCLWHGPAFGYWMTLVLCLIFFYLNKRWYKLRLSKKSLAYLNNDVVNNPVYLLLCRMLNIAVHSYSLMPFFNVGSQGVMYENYSRVKHVYNIMILGGFIGLKALDEVLQ